LQDTLFLAICRQFALVGYNLPFRRARVVISAKSPKACL
jgi:hypothetical protein